MIFELIRDLAEALEGIPGDHPRNGVLRLVHRAIRLDAYFVDRHPTTFFQCLWNSGWWTDSPEAAKHFEPLGSSWPAEGPPWERPGAKLSVLLEGWHSIRNSQRTACPWVRMLRPP